MCVSPIRILRNKIKEDLRVHEGLSLPPLCDDHVSFYFVPCGKCIECANARRKEWTFRVRRQIECGNYKTVMWVRFSWDDEHIPTTREDLSVSIRAFRDRVRKYFAKVNPGCKMDYFLITELGDHGEHTGRLHIHGFLMFTKFVEFVVIHRLWHGFRETLNGYAWLRDATKNDFGVSIGMKRISYCMKYVFKGLKQRYAGESDLTARIFCSLHMGEAHLTSKSFRYVETGDPCSFDLFWIFDGKYKFRYPRYLIEKIYKMLGYRHKVSWDGLFNSVFGRALPFARGSCDRLIREVINQRNAALGNVWTWNGRLCDYHDMLYQIIGHCPGLLQKYNLVYDCGENYEYLNLWQKKILRNKS